MSDSPNPFPFEEEPTDPFSNVHSISDFRRHARGSTPEPRVQTCGLMWLPNLARAGLAAFAALVVSRTYGWLYKG